MRSTCEPASDSWMTRMTGTTPATAPSKRSWTSFSRAVAHSSSPWWASSCLLAVTTCLPAFIARRTYSRAGSRPPISSTIRSERSRMSSKSPRERVSTPTISGRAPATGTIASARSASNASKAPPTVPWPSRPMRKSDIPGHQIVEGLAPHHHARLTAGAEDHGRAIEAVVVVGHRVTVGAGDGRDDHVTVLRVAQRGRAHQHVPGLAVLADKCVRVAVAHAVGDLGFVDRAVEHRAHVVGHPAVHGDEGQPSVLLAADALDVLDAVERDARVGDERPAGLDHQMLVRADQLVSELDQRLHPLRRVRRAVVAGVGDRHPAAEVVDGQLSEAGQRPQRGPKGRQLRQLRAEMEVVAHDVQAL